MKKVRRRILIILLAAGGIVAVAAGMVVSKIWQVNPYFARGYELQGIDVSHYQGKIDWGQIQSQEIDFAFIKATEGSSYVDEYFRENWQAAAQTGLYVGAYHFFSFDSDAGAQAENFISTVGDLEGKIAPVIDVEYYGDKRNSPPDKEVVVTALREMLFLLEECYQIKPIIYTTYPVYHKYIKDNFSEYPLWIRNVYYPPSLDLGDSFFFWQYTDTAVLEGYDGTEKYIDRNVFCGSPEAFRELLVE